jgi:parallel beta-helix repeat protein
MKPQFKIILPLVLIFFTFLPISTVHSETYKSNDISGSETWTLGGSPYIITDDITIMTGAMLTIEPGVEVRFEEGLGLTIRGTLLALGTTSQPIIFTSNSTSPEQGNWQGLIFSNKFMNSTSSLSHVIIEYAQKGVEIGTENPLYDRPPNITYTTFRNCTEGMDLDLDGNFENLTFDNCEDSISGSYDNLKVRNSNFNNCGFTTEEKTSIVFENNTLIADPDSWTGASAYGSSVYIANNTVLGGNGGGLGGGGGKITIIDNVIVNGSIGISDAWGVVANNSITNAWRGISLSYSKGVLVENNLIENITYMGIKVALTDESTFRNNVIVNGTRNPGMFGVFGIYLGSSHYNVLDNNKITHFTEGIVVGQCDGTLITDTVITDSYQDSRGEDPLFEGRGNGIVLSKSSNATILNTVIDGAITGVNQNTGDITIENVTILNSVEGIRGRYGRLWISNSSITTSQYDFYLASIARPEGWNFTIWAENVLFDEQKVYFEDDSSAIYLPDKTLKKEDGNENDDISGNGNWNPLQNQPLFCLSVIMVVILIIIVAIIFWKRRS